MDETITIDQQWAETIRLMEVPESPGLFVLGSFARRVTIYSQQVRALNLVDALASLGYLTSTTKVAVIGGGFAGLTAAAALAKMGVFPHIYEKEDSPLHLQRNCSTRFVHPHIYDWPLTSFADVKANLPLLDWEAGMADDVAKRVQKEWDKIALPATHLHLGTDIQCISSSAEGWRISATEKGNWTSVSFFDIVIIAVGFGVEDDKSNSYTYWADLPLAERVTQDHTWIVSGAGDGALTDVIRLCILNSDHGSTLKLIASSVLELAGQPFLDELGRRVREGVVGVKLFDGLDPDRLADCLNLRQKPVRLNSNEDSIFGTEGAPPRASVLNRLIVWILLKAKKRKLLLIGGRMPKDGIKGNRGNHRFILKSKDETRNLRSQEVLVRHGPIPTIKNPSWLDRPQRDRVEELSWAWENMYLSPSWTDPTLNAKWPTDAFQRGRIVSSFLDYPALLIYSNQVLNDESTVSALSAAISGVLNQRKVRAQFKEVLGSKGDEYLLKGNIPSIVVEQAVVTSRSLAVAVQTLCRAPLAFVDATEATPELAFMLGIRSAVRRGVTILFRKGKMTVDAWAQLPFNFREIRVTDVTELYGPEEFERPVSAAVEEGMRRYARRPSHYSDLPGFDALRNLGGQRGDTGERSSTEEVLLLCPFLNNYDKNCLQKIIHVTRKHFGRTDEGAGPTKRVVDMASPEVLNKRLYEGIRRDVECIVDLTRDRANVFFELGVRLAVNARGARVIRCENLPIGSDEVQVVSSKASSKAIDVLLGAKTYSLGATIDDSLYQALQLDKTVWPGGEISGAFVYEVAQRCNEIREMTGGGKALHYLWDSVCAVAGADMRGQARYPILYAGNNALEANAKRFVFDMLLAYVFLERHTFPDFARNDNASTALGELKTLLGVIDVTEDERKRLQQVIDNS